MATTRHLLIITICLVNDILGSGFSFLMSLSSAQADNSKLIITGSSTMAPLLADIGKRFETTYPGKRVDVQTGGSSRGLADATSGLADIGMVSRALKPQDGPVQGTIIARDGIAIILHATNTVRELSDDQIRQIFTGHLTHWNQAGGQNTPITVVSKAQGRSTLELFLHYFHLRNRDIHSHVVIGDNEQGIKTVAGNPHAIGYVSIGTAQYDATHGIPIKLLPLGQVQATIEAVRDGTFPLSRPLTLVTKSLPVGLIKKFIDFAQSPQAHDLILAHYFVPLQP